MINVQCVGGCTKPVVMPLPPAGYPPIWAPPAGALAARK